MVKKVLWECTDRPQRVDGDAALKMLREAGFVRLSGKLADIMQGITAGIISREEFDKAFGALTLTPGLIEELPPGTAVAWNAQGENRWEVGLRNIVTILRGPRVPFDIPDIVEEVKVLAEGKRPDLQAAYCLGFKSSNNAFNGQTSHPRGERFRNKMDEDLRNLEASQ